MEIHISIRTTQPLSGIAETESQGPVRFEGWLELLHALSTLVGAEVGTTAPPQAPPPGNGESQGDEHES